MWQSKMFIEDQMVAWENKAATHRHGLNSRPTSPKNGWNANNTLPQPNPFKNISLFGIVELIGIF